MPTLILFAVADESSRIQEAESLGLTETLSGPLDPTEQRQAWQSLSRTPPTTVWVEWGNLTPPDLPSLRRFRVSAPQTRIIIEVPESLSPPNEAIAQVVGYGITDIVRGPSTPMAAVLARHGTYADVAAWQGKVHTFDEPEPAPPPAKVVTVETIVEKEVIREKKVAVSTRPTVIAVAGAIPGVGATTLAAAITSYLAQQGWAVALTEYGERPGFPTLNPTAQGVTLFPHPAPKATEIAAKRQYAYVVADMGVANWAAISDTRPDLALWVLPGAKHRMPGIGLPVGLGPQDPLLGVVAPGPDATRIAELWSKKHGIPAIVYGTDSLGPMLAAVLADPPTGWLKWLPRRRRAHIERRPPAPPQTASEAIEAVDNAQDPRYLSPYARELITHRRMHPWSLRRVLVILWDLLVVAVLVSMAAWLSILAVQTHVLHPSSWTAIGARIYAWDLHRLSALWPSLGKTAPTVVPKSPPVHPPA